MTEQVRVGVVGMGWYNDMMHLPILRDDPRANPVSICGRRRAPAEEMARKYDIGDRSQEQKMILHGDAGTLEVDCAYGRGFEVRGARQDEQEIRTIPTPAHILKGVDLNRPLIDQAAHIITEQRLGLHLFFDAILDGKPASPDFSEGLKVQEVVDAALESDKKRCWIPLPRGGV